MKEYHKIQTVYKRDPDNNYKTLLIGDWSIPEFSLLKDIDWVWTEKIDGTNIRVIWDGFGVKFKGRTDKADIPKHLLSKLQKLFTHELMSGVFPDLTVGTTITLYGEGYGVKIQKGGNYIPNDVDFILFDIKVGGWWLQRGDIESLAGSLGISATPVIGIGTLTQAIQYCAEGLKSLISHNREYDAEGLVMKPLLELFARNGDRIVTKIKTKDFHG